MKKTMIIIMAITILSKLLGFVREMTLSYFYGASNISDAFLVSQTIPIVIISFLGTAIYTGYIPIISEIKKNHGEIESNKYTNNLVNTLFLICIVIVIIGWVFTEEIVKLFASGFDDETLDLATKLTRIGFLAVYFICLKEVFSGYLQMKGNYIIPSLIGIPMNFILVLTIFISYKTNVMVLSIGSVVAFLSQIILVIPFLSKHGYKYDTVIDVKDKYIKKMIKISLPVVLGLSVNQINTLVDRTLASRIIEGGISAINYSNYINGFAQGIFVSAIIAIVYPQFSKMVSENDMANLEKSIIKSINLVCILIVPSSIGVMLFNEEIVKLTFGRGAFDIQAINLTSNTLFFYSIGMVGYSIRDILSKVFYSFQDTKTPMTNAAIGMALNITLNIILSKYLGLGGLALATSLSGLITAILMFLSLKRRNISLEMTQIYIIVLKVLFASVVMGIVSKVSFLYLNTLFSQNLSFLIAILIAIITYLLSIYLLKVEEFTSLVKTITNKH
ncbi:murein biosynthesis integral membrane protein MurJ [Schinkia azotoformans]|uniref:murein biosynthesis integral membrane protein MurJ n=1 Tax=Schinkia azotoformans TaxID=1454 RepID=UPI002E219E82|nr:murein biosynthesis integral membrane protein MurJ [Schinkia azotoformans]MED4351105.1 murein biosynthesis integral membrane protein MurJ [Schinkia azotoformans]